MFDLFDLGGRNNVAQQLRRIEAKLDLMVEHLGISWTDPAAPTSLSDDVMALAEQGRKIQAITRHRELTGASLAEAKAAVEGCITETVGREAGA